MPAVFAVVPSFICLVCAVQVPEDASGLVLDTALLFSVRRCWPAAGNFCGLRDTLNADVLNSCYTAAYWMVRAHIAQWDTPNDKLHGACVPCCCNS